MTHRHATFGTCATAIDIEIDGDRLGEVRFHGGCRGNAQGIAALVRDMPVTEAVARLRGIVCRNGTSCPDQLARALAQWNLQRTG